MTSAHTGKPDDSTPAPGRTPRRARVRAASGVVDPGAAPEPHGSSVARRFRPHAFADGLRVSAVWTARGIIVLAGLVILWYVTRALWSIVLPTLFALLLASVLWPVNRFLRRGLPRVFAAIVTLFGFIGAVVGIGALTVPAIATGITELSGLARDNVAGLAEFAAGPPFNLDGANLDEIVDTALTQLQSNVGNVVTGITTGLSELTSGTVVVLLALVFTFFCLKDGDRFLPWAARWTNSAAYSHASTIAGGTWKTLSSYIFAQATVALVDAVFIGLGLVLLDIPLAIPLAVLVFFSAFIPVVGAIVSGLVATLVAFLAYGWVTALIVLGLVVLVQQLESNFIQPLLVGRTLEIHPAVVLASVTAGGTLFGIIGAFFAVPTTAVAIVVLRYLRDQSIENLPETGVASGDPEAKPVSPDDRDRPHERADAVPDAGAVGHRAEPQDD
ncbi:AI-2E family transporter [Arthrobacter sp. NamB2]|uniref:AI-2E family transporter n=1 Tax=Arthrobacter sp. NamB2 TaxID=2576035 RepID=UPI0010C9EE95|nr:AI-2E family transporter [Arthrobacter sp. NamB2]TKV28460.1 AI-2E family transporter [Arthrobacter sp. NamB2]